VTVTLKNLSGKDIPFELTDWQTYDHMELEDILGIAVYPISEHFEWAYLRFEVADGRDKKLIEKDAIIQRTVEYRIEEFEDYEVSTEVVLHMDYDDKELITIKTEPIKIDVRRQKK